MKTYKKIVAHAPGHIAVEQVAYDLALTSPHEVIVRNKYSHISTGTELACLAGLEGWFQMPATPGYTAVGEVLEIGAAVTCCKAGDLVYTFGPHAAYFKIDTTDRWHGVCVPLPANVPPQLAAFTHMAGIAMTALRKSSIELGDDVAVVGMGPIGILAAQLAQLQGARVVGVDISDSRLAIAAACGVRTCVNSKEKSLKTLLDKATNGRGVSTLIDASGVPQVIEAAAACLNLYGELILLGSPRAAFETNLTPFLQRIHLWGEGAIEVKGALEFTYPTHPTEFVKHSITRNSEIILELMRVDKLQVAPLLSHVLPVEKAAEAYQGLAGNPDAYVGVVFDWES